MTLSGDGSGTLAYRVHIDGCPSEIVTHSSMVRAASAGVASRLEGLWLRGQKFSAQADPIACTLKVGGLTVRAVDSAQAWSAVFGKAPTRTTWLTADATASATTITVASTAGFASAGYIWIDSECIAYTSLGGGGVTFEGCTRGSLSQDSDAETYHYITDGARRRSPEVTDHPVLWENRRVRVYRYQETDSLTGDGTQVYLGIISTSPQFDGKTWSFGVESIASILSQTLGADLDDAAYPRGILYPPDYPCTVNIWESSTTGAGAAATLCAASVTGHFETQVAFCDAMTAAILAAQTAAGQTNIVEAKPDGDVGWHLEYTTLANPNHKAVSVCRGRRCSLVDSIFGSDSGAPQDARGREVATVAADTRYYFWPSPTEYLATGIAPHFTAPTGIPGAGSVPRGIFDVPSGDASIYLGGASSISSLMDSITIEWAAVDGASEITDTYTLGTYTVATRLITMSGVDYVLGVGGVGGRRVWTSVSMPSIRFGLRLSEFGGLPVGVVGLLRTIIANQAEFSTLGVVPMMRAGDWDETAWNAMIAGQPQFVTRRWYSTFSPVSLGEIVKEELKLARHFLSIDSSGRIVPKMIRLPAASELSTTTSIGQTTLLTDEEMLSHEVSGLGQINEVVIKTGYDPRDDKFLGRTVKVRDVAAYGQSPSVRAMSIAPKSQYLGPPITENEAVAVSSGIFGTFAGSYAVDTVDAAMHDDVQLGDPAVFSQPHQPDEEGVIGVTDLVGLVIGRVAGVYSPRTRLTMLTTNQKVGGYAPAADVSSQNDNGGNEWDLTLSTSLFPAGTDCADWFADLDRVRVIEFNDSTATVVVGTVVGTPIAPIVIVQFDGVWTPGASSWYLTMANSTDASFATTQRRFCSIADASGVIDYAADDQPAFRFGA